MWLVWLVIIAYAVHFIYLRIRAVRVCVSVGLEKLREINRKQKNCYLTHTLDMEMNFYKLLHNSSRVDENPEQFSLSGCIALGFNALDLTTDLKME